VVPTSLVVRTAEGEPELDDPALSEMIGVIAAGRGLALRNRAEAVGSVVLTVPHDLVPEQSCLDILVGAAMEATTPVGIGLIGNDNRLLHCGAVPLGNGGRRPLGEGCDRQEFRLGEATRRGVQLLAPYAQLVTSPGVGAVAAVSDVAVGTYIGGVYAVACRSSGSVPRGLAMSFRGALPNAILVVGTTGDAGLDRKVIGSFDDTRNIVRWTGHPVEPEARVALDIDAMATSVDTLAAMGEIDIVVHLDDTVVGHPERVLLLARARPFATWIGLSGSTAEDFSDRLDGVVAVEQLASSVRFEAGESAEPAIGSIGSIEPRNGVVSVVIPVFGNWALTARCIESVRREWPDDVEIVVVDDASTDDTAERLRSMHDVVVVTNQRNLGFPTSVNRGIAATTGEFVCVLNNDTIVAPGSLDSMMDALEMDNTVLVGPRSNEVSGLQRIAEVPNWNDLDDLGEWAAAWTETHRGSTWRTNRLVGYCLLARRTIFERFGGFDERFGRGNCEDDELCDRLIDAGFDLRVSNDAVVLHQGSATFSALDEDFMARLRLAGSLRSDSQARSAGAISVIVLSDGNRAGTEASVWSLLGLTDHVRVVERRGGDQHVFGLARGSRLGVEVLTSDWQTVEGASAAFAGVDADVALVVMAGEVAEADDWGTARAELERHRGQPLAINIGHVSEVRAGRPDGDLFTQLGRHEAATIESMCLHAAPTSQRHSTHDTGSTESDGSTADVLALVLSDGADIADIEVSAVSCGEISERVVVLERSAGAVPGDELMVVDWTDENELTAAICDLDAKWFLVVEAGERLLVDSAGWISDLCVHIRQASTGATRTLGVPVGDVIEARLALASDSLLRDIGSETGHVSTGLRIVPATIEHRDVIGLRFPDLAARSSIDAALSGDPLWAEKLAETLILDEELRLLEQMRHERPIDWHARDARTIGCVIPFDPDRGCLGVHDPDPSARLSDTVLSALGQSVEPNEVVVVSPRGVELPAAVVGRVRHVEHTGLDRFDSNESRIARLTNLGCTVVDADWICVVDPGDCLRVDHLEHTVEVAYADRSEYVHALVAAVGGSKTQIESAETRQERTVTVGPVMFHSELRALTLRPDSWSAGEKPGFNRVKRLRLIGVDESVAEAVTVSRPVRAVHHRQAKGQVVRSGAVRLHLGCGPNLLQDWTNIDLDARHRPDVVHDLSEGLPFDDASVATIYSEHFFEHLKLEDGLKLLTECHRVLEVNGVIRIAMPDLRSTVEAYLDNWRRQAWVKDFPALDSAAHMLNFGMREWGHQYVYDLDDLVMRLTDIGFRGVTSSDWGESSHEHLRGLETRPDSLLIVEATV